MLTGMIVAGDIYKHCHRNILTSACYNVWSRKIWKSKGSAVFVSPFNIPLRYKILSPIDRFYISQQQAGSPAFNWCQWTFHFERMMKEYSILNMGIIGYALFKPSVGNVWGLFIEFEIIHGSRLSAVSLSYEDSDWSRFRFYKVSQYGYICYKLPNSLSLCSVCYHEPKKKKRKTKVSMNEKSSP